MSAVAAYARDLRLVLRLADFRRLLATRLTSQFSDGLFQVALASLFFFSPERQAAAGDIAAAFAALLLPYSLIGPFAGVLLDRWRRRQVLVWANAARTVMVLGVGALVLLGPPGPVLYAVVLACVSANRFLLAALSAALPHVVPEDELVVANAVTPTSGTLAAVCGGVTGFALSRFLGSGSTTDARLLAAAAAGYAAAALLALRMASDLLGPDLADREHAAPRGFHALSHVARGLVEGIRHVAARRAAASALAAIAAHRFCFGLSTITALLLYRNFFAEASDVEAGLAGLARAFAAAGAGFVTAGVLTPPAARRTGTSEWIVVCLLTAAATEAVFVAALTPDSVVIGSFVLGLTAQSMKICVDTLVQEHVDDEFRGRVFSMYDVLFNVAFVSAAAVAAFAVPTSGRSAALYAVIAGGYAATALAYARAARVGRPPRAVRRTTA